MTTVHGDNDALFSALRGQWQSTSQQSRKADLARLTEEWREVEWRSGGRTLLAALGLQFNEVTLCRGLAWLLDPDGGHELGRSGLHALLQDLGLSISNNASVQIHVEESSSDTRADIVLRVGGQTVIIEAKVFAGERDRQADRLYERWAAEDPTLVFLTRTGHAPHTASKSKGLWLARTWRDVARLMRAAATDGDLKPSSGAREFIESIGAL